MGGEEEWPEVSHQRTHRKTNRGRSSPREGNYFIEGNQENYSLSGGKYSMERKFMNIIHYQVGSTVFYGKEIHEHFSLSSGKYFVEGHKESYSIPSEHYSTERIFMRIIYTH